jgi:hypothetical protein
VFVALAQSVLHLGGRSVQWYGIDWQGQGFVITSLAVFTAWVWLGAYRMMSDLLAVRSIPWAAVSFAVFVTVYLCGFIDGQAWSFSSRFAVIGSMIGGAIVYLEAWKERRDWIAVKRFFRAWREETIERGLEATPAWLVVAAFTLTVSLVTSLLPSNHPYLPGLPSNVIELLTLSPTVLTLLMFRDIGLLYFFSLGDRPDRATSTTVIYLTILYFVLPALLNLIGLGFLAMPALPSMETGAAWLGVIVAAGHLAVVGALLKQRLQPV